ncbi:MAG: helicase-related protein [Erysipelotrichaceae bacterium]
MTRVLDSNKIGAVGEYIKEQTNSKSNIIISSPIFTIFAFEELRTVLTNCDSFRFMFNEPTFIRHILNKDKEVREFQLLMQERERNVSEFSLEIGLKNNLDQNQIAEKCYKFIKDKAEVKSTLKSGTVTPNTILVVNENSDNFFINGSNVAFSKDGLGYTQTIRYDFNTVETDQTTVKNFIHFFDSIFSNDDVVVDVKEELLKHLTNLYKENSPELLYFLTLYNIFGKKLINLDDMARVKERTGIVQTKIWNSLYNFQHDAVVGAIKKIELYNGCIIADSVGLGKTFEALAIIKYYELRNDRVLVLTPKKLRNNWTSFRENSTTNMFAEDRFNYDVLNHTDLSREKGKSGDINLATINWGNYDLLVIDESHNFRNNNAVKGKETRYQKLMNYIIKNGVKTKVLLLSATPVNNRLADLKNQIMFITEDNDEAFKKNAGINSIENTLRIAQQRFGEWSRLPEEEQITKNLLPMLDYNFFNLLNTVTIARSRKHIQTYYDTKDIGEFPQRMKPISIKSDIDLNNDFPSLSKVNGLIAGLHLAIYSPMLYILPNRLKLYEELYDQEVKEGKGSFKQVDRERNIVNLMRVNIFKRLESSVNSFTLTLDRILKQIENMMALIDSESFFDLNESSFSEDELDDIEVGGKIKVKVKDLDVLKIKQDLIEDKDILKYLLEYSNAIIPTRDAKLLDLKNHITQKVENPINEGNKKIIIFTSFSDTAEYLYDNIQTWLLEKHHLYCGIVTGGSMTKTNLDSVSNNFESILVNFSPRSNRMNVNQQQIDMLIATDCISEGQNLQDCDYLINYDIHWNPVRIIQRFGRIDRIGSINKFIQLVNFWPNLELDEYINLENRVKNKMVILDLSATGEDDLLSEEGKNLEYRKNQLKQLQNEVLDLEEMQGSISITDLTLDDFIMSLDRFMKENPNVLEKYPTGVHAVTSITDRVRSECSKGVIYCLKQKNYTNTQEGATSLYPYFLVYVRDSGDVHIKNTNPKKILDIYKALCQSKNQPIESLVKDFNKETKNGNDMSKYTQLLEKAVFDIKGIVEQKGIQSLFKMGQATLLENSVSGLNDFELISFLVVK